MPPGKMDEGFGMVTTVTNLNIIEKLWRDLKHAIHARTPKNIFELEVFCQEEWGKIPKAKNLKHS